VAGLCAMGILFTVTRAAWISSVAGTIVALLAGRETRRFLVPGMIVTALGVVVALAAIPGLDSRAHNRANDRKPIWDRDNSNAAAVRMIDQRPVLGFGWGRWERNSFDYYRQSPNYPLSFVRNVHNVYLSNAVDLGLLGAGLWLFAVAVVAAGAILRRGPPWLRPWKLAFIGLATAYGLTALSTPLGFAESTMLLWTWAGLAWTARTAPVAATPRHAGDPTQRPRSLLTA